MLSPDRLFQIEPTHRALARRLFESVANLPIVSPHSHVEARLFAEPDLSFDSPVDMFILRDHYILRMLYSQGVHPTLLFNDRREMAKPDELREIWQAFIEHFYFFHGTPTGLWIQHELEDVFGVEIPIKAENAQAIYDQVADCLDQPEYSPRALFERFNIKTLCTTDPAYDKLLFHSKIRQSGWGGDIRPTFRVDGVVNLLTPAWKKNLELLCQSSSIDVRDYPSFVRALETCRQFFKEMGATATDHSVESALTGCLEPKDADTIFQHALRGEITHGEAEKFTAQMIIELARMSVEDGLVMQLHAGPLRNHNQVLYSEYGTDLGADLPVQVEMTRALRPLLNMYGNDSRLTLILFTLDETNYAREMAPLAGHYPALKLGPPWWFHDSPNGMRRYFDQVMETAGIYNTVGFNDDTRSFCSIPARHDVWRRVSCDWLAGLVLQGLLNEEDGFRMAAEMAVGLAIKAYKL